MLNCVLFAELLQIKFSIKVSIWIFIISLILICKPSRFGLVVAHPDLDWEASGSSPGHTNDFKIGTYCSSACAGHNELE